MPYNLPTTIVIPGVPGTYHPIAGQTKVVIQYRDEPCADLRVLAIVDIDNMTVIKAIMFDAIDRLQHLQILMAEDEGETLDGGPRYQVPEADYDQKVPLSLQKAKDVALRRIYDHQEYDGEVTVSIISFDSPNSK